MRSAAIGYDQVEGEAGHDALTHLRLELNGTTNNRLLAQLPAVLLHNSFFDVYRFQPWTTARVQSGGKAVHAWLVPMSDSLLARQTTDSWSNTAWLSKDIARVLDIAPGSGGPIILETTAQVQRVLPVRIDNFVGSETLVVGASTRKSLGRLILASTGSRVAVVKTTKRRSRQQPPSTVRMNFHMRRLLDVIPDPSTGTQQVQLASYHPVRAPASRSATTAYLVSLPVRGAILFLEILGRFFLRAPRVTLASEEALANDDVHTVARVPAYAAELLGVTGGDSIYVYWGRRSRKVRVHVLSDKAEPIMVKQRIVDWTPTPNRAPADRESSISLPAKVRASLGMPRNAVVVARRSLLSVLRRRLVALTLPLVAIAVSVVKLELDARTALLLLVGTLVLTLAGDRMPNTRSRRY